LPDHIQTTPGLLKPPTQAKEKFLITEMQTDPSPLPEISKVELSPTHEIPVLAFGSPIGSEIQFVIHRVGEGETLQMFADHYNTCVEAIKAVNYDLISPLWVDWLVIIPINLTDVSNLPPFEACLIEEEDISIEEIAIILDVLPKDICFINGFDPDHILQKGEWVHVPRSINQP
jgi:hypothetical protein